MNKTIAEKRLIGKGICANRTPANAWATKSSLTADDVQKNLFRLQSYELEIFPVNFSLLAKASQLTKQYRVSVYDAVYAVIAEEIGFIGSTIFILLFVYFVVKGITIAKNSPDRFSYLLATGITAFTVGGTSILIVVSVALEIMKQVDAQLSMYEY